MIVVDASAIVELLTDEHGYADDIAVSLGDDTRWIAPEHVLTEAANAMRGLWLGGHSTRDDFMARLDALAQIEVERYPISPLLGRMGVLAPNANAYDAAYLALAEAVDAPLVTVDRKFSGVSGARADIRLIS